MLPWQLFQQCQNGVQVFKMKELFKSLMILIANKVKSGILNQMVASEIALRLGKLFDFGQYASEIFTRHNLITSTN